MMSRCESDGEKLSIYKGYISLYFIYVFIFLSFSLQLILSIQSARAASRLTGDEWGSSAALTKPVTALLSQTNDSDLRHKLRLN